MAEHKQNAYIAGASVMCGLSTLWWVGWGVAVGTAPTGDHRGFFTVWSYLALVPFVGGLLIFVGLIRDWSLPGLKDQGAPVAFGPGNQRLPARQHRRLQRRQLKEGRRTSNQPKSKPLEAHTSHEYVSSEKYGELVRLLFSPKYLGMRCRVQRIGTSEIYDMDKNAGDEDGAKGLVVLFPDGFIGAGGAKAGDYRALWEIANTIFEEPQSYRELARHDFLYSPPDMNTLIRREYQKQKAAIVPGPETVIPKMRAQSMWNQNEKRAYLELHRNDSGNRTFRVTIDDPTDWPCEHMVTQDKHRITVLFPDDFEHPPKPLVSGPYKVSWALEFPREEGTEFELVAQSDFYVPY